MVIGGPYRRSKDPVKQFKIYLQRQGWTVTQALTQAGDPRVLRIDSPSLLRLPDQLYEFLERKTTRKLLRALLTGPRTREQLLKICSNGDELDSLLARFVEEGIAIQQDGRWEKGSVCANLHDIGPTLEWMVAEWFRLKLDSPAQHGVTIAEVPKGGDLDVVALVNNLRVWVECKSGHPRSFTDDDLRLYLQRAHDFNPEMAVLLIDTDSSIDELIGRLNRICEDMQRQLLAYINPPAKDQPIADSFEPRYKKELWWSSRNRFVTNVVKSVDTSLLAVLRLYHSEIRHYIYLYGRPEYAFDYVNNRVTKLEK